MEESQATAEAKFDHWCIVELMGHQRIAGRVTEANLFGGALMRVDVPESDGKPGFSKFYGAGAIYAITPVEEKIVRAMAKAYDQRPVEEWQLKRLLPEPVEDPSNDYDYTEEDDDADADDFDSGYDPEEDDDVHNFGDRPYDFDDEPDYSGQDFTNPDGDKPVEEAEANTDES